MVTNSIGHSGWMAPVDWSGTNAVKESIWNFAPLDPRSPIPKGASTAPTADRPITMAVIQNPM